MKPMAVAFCGKIASGKSTVAKEVATRLGWPLVSFGDQVRHLAAQRGLDPSSREILQQIGEEQIQGNLSAFCCNVLSQAGNRRASDGIVIDGLRHVEVATELLMQLRPLLLQVIFIETPDSARIERVQQHQGGIDPTRWDTHSTEIQVPSRLRSMAKVIIRGDMALDVAAMTVLAAISND